eukprot:5936404-Amphidinium_carterae.1
MPTMTAALYFKLCIDREMDRRITQVTACSKAVPQKEPSKQWNSPEAISWEGSTVARILGSGLALAGCNWPRLENTISFNVDSVLELPSGVAAVVRESTKAPSLGIRSRTTKTSNAVAVDHGIAAAIFFSVPPSAMSTI